MRQEVARARQTGAGAVKLIHGYGSSGTGGRIRPAIRKTIAQMQRRREINDFLYGEDFHRGCENGRRVLGRMPYLDRDSDYNRNNPGITIVLL